MAVPTRAVALVPLSEAELADFIARQVVGYAEHKHQAGFWSAEEAFERSRAELAGLGLLDGEALRQGHRFLKAVDQAGKRVGWLWVAPPATQGWAFLYQITVEAAVRHQGYGRAMLAALEELLAGEGVGELRLNVFRFNTPALRLYEQSGYEPVFESDRAATLRKLLRRVR